MHFCATCDSPFYRGAKHLLVIGGGNSGLEEGLFLTQFVEHVTVVERSGELHGSRLLQDKVRAHPQMTVLMGTGVAEFKAGEDGKLRTVTLVETEPGATSELEAAGAFVFIGLDPNTGWLGGAVELDAAGLWSLTVCSPPRYRGSSQPATCVTGRPNSSPRPSAKGQPQRSRCGTT